VRVPPPRTAVASPATRRRARPKANRWRNALGAAGTVGLLGGLLFTSPLPAQTSTAFSATFPGTPSSPQSVVPVGWDVQIHKRDSGDAMEPMDAGHGLDCGAPPATHTITTLAQGVFICKNHLMTAIGDSGYGEIALTPAAMADWSTGTSAITFNVSTQQDNSSDWIEVWITPYMENQTLPFENNSIDFQGPPKDAIVVTLNMSGLMGTHSGDVHVFSNYADQGLLPKVACTSTGDQTCIQPAGVGPSVLPLSPVTRSLYEIDLSQGHIKVGLPGVMTWTDTSMSVPFTQGVVQLVHHSYNPLKHDPGTGIDTWHWSGLAISQAVPFTIINGDERSLHPADTPPCSGLTCAAVTTIHFPEAAPVGSYLRFSGIGTIKVSSDGGATWQAAVRQGPHYADEHFQSYFTPIPAGTQSVLVSGTDYWGGSWWMRDPAIWSLNASSAAPAPIPVPSLAPPPPAPSPTPVASPTPAVSPTPPPAIPISGMPCTVVINGVSQSGTCSGMFQPKQ